MKLNYFLRNMTLTNMAELSEEIQTEANHDCDIVQLSPFQHQVGGHNCVLSYDDKTICKPLNEQEHKVYSHFPDELKQFVPKLYGIVKVYYERCGDDVLCFALPLDCPYCKDLKRFKNYLIAKNVLTQESFPAIKDNEEDTDNRSEDQWISVMRERLLAKYKQNRTKGRHLEKFILLENISKRFKYPCAMDLKMGTRGFGDDATREKRERKQQRVNMSTSGALGVRLCGMQVYNKAKDEFVFTDKYKGRHFTHSDFENAMKDFFFNGTHYRLELMPPLIEKLKTLLELVEKIDCYRFYCSSLLLMYDGQQPGDSSAEVEVRMIDFAQSRVKAEETNYHIGPDQGYILGLKSLINIFSDAYASLSSS